MTLAELVLTQRKYRSNAVSKRPSHLPNAFPVPEATPERIAAAKRELLLKYRRGVEGWIEWGVEILGLKPYDEAGNVFTPDQVEALRSVFDNPRTLMQSGYGVGKTFLAAFVVIVYLCLYESEVICTSSSGFQVKERLWAEVRKMLGSAAVPVCPPEALNATSLSFGEKWSAHAVSTNNPANIQGGHAPHTLFVMDEGQGVEDEIWDAAESMMSSTHARMLVLFNPLYTSGRAHKATHRPDIWRCIRMSGLNHPNVTSGRELIKGAITREWIESRRRDWGEASPLFQARALGLFPKTSANKLLSVGELEDVADLDPKSLVRDGRHLGVDISSTGSDFCVAVLVENREVVFVDRWQDPQLMASTGRIVQLIRDFDVPGGNVHVDGNGVGAGVVSRLQELGYDVDNVVNGAKPVGDWDADFPGSEYANRRSEMLWVVSRLIKTKQVRVPREFERIVADLVDVNYAARSDGRIQIESKDEIRKRLRRSPDDGDAFVNAFSRAGSVAPRIDLV